MFRVAILLISLVGVVLLAHADETPSMPYSEAELEQALAARVPEPVRRRLVVQAAEQRVSIRLDDALRRVDLGAARGEEAARVIALIAREMALDPPAWSASAAPRALQAAPVVRPQPAPPPLEPRDRLRLGVDFAAQRGLLAQESFSFDLGLAVSRYVSERWMLALRAGYWTVPPARSRTGTTVRFDALSLRPAIGVRLSMFELSAGGMFAQYWVRGGQGHQDQLFGLSAQVAVWLRLVSALRFVARLSFDGFINRARLLDGSDRVLTTPRLMLGLALGFAWGLG